MRSSACTIDRCGQPLSDLEPQRTFTRHFRQRTHLMAKSDREERAQWLLREPRILANIPPTIGQRRTAGIMVLVLLVILAALWPFAAVKLPKIVSFVPSLAA